MCTYTDRHVRTQTYLSVEYINVVQFYGDIHYIDHTYQKSSCLKEFSDFKVEVCHLQVNLFQFIKLIDVIICIMRNYNGSAIHFIKLQKSFRLEPHTCIKLTVVHLLNMRNPGARQSANHIRVQRFFC